jgi:hypothetical protein
MLNPDYAEMLSLLIANRVEFMVIGAYTLAYHGHPRATGDIDIFVRCSDGNSRNIHRALSAFGAPVADLDPAYFAQPGNYFQIGVAPCRIDILNEIDGVRFDDAASEQVSIDGLTLPVIAKADFIRNKRAAGRPKDLADLASLES